MTYKNKEYVSTSVQFDDEQRVRIISPGMLVTKRFFRNRLAVIGLLIIVSMFLFSFLGGLFVSYGESQVFKDYDTMEKDYAGAAVNTDYQYILAEGATLPSDVKAKLILAINQEGERLVAEDVVYALLKEGEAFYRVVQCQDIGTVISMKGIHKYIAADSEKNTAEIKTAYADAVSKGKSNFDIDGTTYYINKNGKKTVISVSKDICIISKLIFNTYAADTVLSYNFRLAAEKAMNEKTKNFEVNGSSYEMELEEEDDSAVFYIVNGSEKQEYAIASNISINAIENDTLSNSFREAVKECIDKEEKSFLLKNKEGVEEEYVLVRKNNQYLIRKNVRTQLISVFKEPSKAHWLGTDGNGMDILTRLMYGGKISLMIGFFVVALETFIGVILGGIAGYFGRWIDTLIMRLVDIVNCIPALPFYIILGSLMDYMRIDPKIRIYLLMIILAILQWPNTARMVRGQILSLREQEFMIAEEALGIRVSRRIYKHLIPNVIPQLTVLATMSLGATILSEATLSFLGLGVKFPYASWGNIINAVSNLFVMTNYWYVWIPAGFLILITVLGFNFIGDGLRDAFDPKMKR